MRYKTVIDMIQDMELNDDDDLKQEMITAIRKHSIGVALFGLRSANGISGGFPIEEMENGKISVRSLKNFANMIGCNLTIKLTNINTGEVKEIEVIEC